MPLIVCFRQIHTQKSFYGFCGNFVVSLGGHCLFLSELNFKYANCWCFKLNLLTICRSSCGRQALFALGYFPEVCTKIYFYKPHIAVVGKFKLFE